MFFFQVATACPPKLDYEPRLPVREKKQEDSNHFIPVAPRRSPLQEARLGGRGSADFILTHACRAGNAKTRTTAWQNVQAAASNWNPTQICRKTTWYLESEHARSHGSQQPAARSGEDYVAVTVIGINAACQRFRGLFRALVLRIINQPRFGCT